MGEGASARTCPACSRAVQPEWRICPWCNAALPVPHGPLVQPCRSCGAMVWVKATNCARCGAAVAPAGAPPGVPVPMAFTPPPEPGDPPLARRPRVLGRLRPHLGDRGTAAALAITLALMLVIGGGAAVLGNWNGIGQTLGPNCSFGVTGTGASITVRGWSSEAACKALRNEANFQTYDLPREASDQPVICDYPLLNDRIVVHDQAAGTAGDSLCRALHDAFSAPSPTPSP